MRSHRRTTNRRYRKYPDRGSWVFSDLNHELTADRVARILADAALARVRQDREDARLAAEAEERQRLADEGSEEVAS